jgi:hypothetical protein
MTIRMKAASTASPMATEATAAARRIKIKGLTTWCSRMAQMVGGSLTGKVLSP